MNFKHKQIDEEFFVIDSENLNLVETKLYGFAIIDDGGGAIIQNSDLNENISLDGAGSYVYIEKLNENGVEFLKIHQDFSGGYGLYVYENDDYFAISNSFLKLLEFIKEKFIISLNKEYADTLLTADLCSPLFGETLINEIQSLNKNIMIMINIKEKLIKYIKINYNENSVPINSKEGMEILDDWFYKWVNVIRSIKLKTDNISFDLSGGFDSRAMLTLMLSSNIDLNTVKITSIVSDKHTYKEDYEIASAIAECFGFRLNNPTKYPQLNYADVNDVVNNSFYTKLGFNKQLNFRYAYYIQPHYKFMGFGGECLRSHWDMPIEDYLFNLKKRALSKDSSNSVEKMIYKCLDKLKDEAAFKNNPRGILDQLYSHGRCANHCGKGTVEQFMTNTFDLSPLLDPNLHKLKLFDENCDDNNLLITVIYSRFCPKLLDFKFDGGRYIDKNTINHAFELNNKYPFKKEIFPLISKTQNEVISLDDIDESLNAAPIWGESDKFIEEVFFSRSFRKLFEIYYDDEVYKNIADKFFSSNFFPLEEAIVSIAIIKAIDAINFSINKKFNSIKWLNHFSSDKTLIKDDHERHNTSRVDIKLLGNPINTVELLYCSDYSNVYSPSWFKDKNGVGTIIESNNNYLEFKIRCVGEGKLNFAFKGIDIRDNNGNRIPEYVNYTRLEINNEIIFNDNKLTWHDNPFKYEMDVKNNEVVNVSLRWMSF